MTWTTRASRTVYENPWIHVREDQVTGPHGDEIYGVVRMQHPAVFVIALDCVNRVRDYVQGRALVAGGVAADPAAVTDVTRELKTLAG